MVNCSNKIKIDETINMLELIVTCPITLFGGLFNTIALWVFCCRMRKWTETRIYMINLAVADCTLVFTLPFVTYFHFQKWPQDVFCEVITIIFCINLPVSNSIITLIALDRYIAIKHPLKAKVLRSPRKAVIICLFLWFYYVLFPFVIKVNFPLQEQVYCFYRTTEYSLFLLFYIFSFFISLLILIFCSTQIIRCLKKKQNAGVQEGNITQKALRIISVNMVTFIVCSLPFNVSLLVRYGADAADADCGVLNTINKVVSIALCISHLNCCLDAICYYLIAKEFQEAASFLPFFHLKQFRSLQIQCNRRLAASELM